MRRAYIGIAVAVLVVALAAALQWLTGTGALLESTRARVVDEATRTLGREVQVDAIAGDPFRGVVLSGVRIGSPPQVAGPLFAAPRVTVYFASGRLVRDLARRRGIAGSITRVVLERPLLILARDADGQWNYADLLSRQRDAGGPVAFRGQVEIAEGSVVFSDALRVPQRAGPRPPSPFAAHFDRITGTLDFRSSPSVGVVLDLVNTDGRTPAIARVTGKASLGESTFDLDLTTRGGSVDFWGPYIVRLPWLEWSGGTFDGTFHLLAARWKTAIALDYRGTLRMRDGKALLLPQKTLLSDIDGPLAVDNLGVATAGLTMAVDASPVWVRGSISHHAGVYLDLALRSDALDLRTLQTLLFPHARVRLAGRAGGDARIVGPFGSPRLEGEIVQASGTINRQSFANASGRFSYYGGLLVFDDVAAAAGGGRVQGHARLNFGEGRFFVLADAQSIEASALSGVGLRFDPTLRGRASGVLAVAGDSDGILAQGRVVAGPGRALGVAFDRLDAIVGYDHGQLDVERLDARSGPTKLAAAGTVSRSGGLDIALSGLDVNLGTIADRFGLRRWLAGTADVAGRVEGSLEAPALVATVRARDGQLGPFPFDDARGPIRLTTAGFSTPGMVLFDGAGRFVASGDLQWTDPGRVNLTVEASDVAAQRLLEIVDIPVRVGGTVQGTVHLGGSLRTPHADGTIELRAGHIEGQRVDRADAAFRWTGSELQLERLSAQTSSSTIEAQGTVARSGALGITFSASHLDLRDVAALRIDALQAQGHVDLTGTLSGSIRSPLIAGTVTSNDLVLNGQVFTRAEGAVRYERGRLRLLPLALRQDGGAFILSGAVGLESGGTLDLQITSRGGELATLLGLARVNTPFTLRGALDGTLVASGRLDDPRATLALTLSDGRLGDHVIRSAALRADFAAQALNLRTLRVEPEQGELVGAGRIDLRGPSEVEFGATGLSLDLLRPIFNIRRPLGGTLDFTLQLSGELSDPLVGVSISAADGSIGAASFDRLVVQAFYRTGQLNIEHGLLQEDRHKVRLTGSVPFNPARLRFDEARPMSLRLELVDSDLSVLGLLTDRVERAEGPLSGEVTVTGTVARPHMEGSLTAVNGTVKLRGIDPALEGIGGQIALSEDTLRVVTLTGRMGGGDVSLSGTVGIRSFRLDRLALQLSATGVRLEMPQLYTGLVDAGLRIGGTAAQPELAGTATFSRGDLFVSSLSHGLGNGNGSGTARTGVNPALDVDLVAGDALWVNVGGLHLQIHGAVHAAGTWRQPRLAGEATADRGTFVAFNNAFTLTEGRAAFTEFRGITPYIDANAETRINVVRRPAAGAPERTETVRVFLHVTGTPDALNLALSSDPPLAREEIIAGLARQVGVTRLLAGESLESVLRAELSNALFGSFGRAVARAFGFEEFAIEYDFVRPLTLRIGGRLIKDLYLTLTSEFGVPRRTVWALEYRLTPSTMFTFSVDNFGIYEFLYRVTYRF